MYLLVCSWKFNSMNGATFSKCCGVFCPSSPLDLGSNTQQGSCLHLDLDPASADQYLVHSISTANKGCSEIATPVLNMY